MVLIVYGLILLSRESFAASLLFVLLDVVEAKGEDLDDDLKEDFLPVFALINRTRVGFLHGRVVL